LETLQTVQFDKHFNVEDYLKSPKQAQLQNQSYPILECACWHTHARAPNSSVSFFSFSTRSCNEVTNTKL
jgi:hypothetical protein